MSHHAPSLRRAGLALVVSVCAASPAVAQNWKLDLEVPASGYQDLFATRVAEGFRVVALTARQGTVESRFQVTWIRDGLARWLARHDETLASLQSTAGDLKRRGYRPLFVESYGGPRGELFVSAWVPDPAVVWELRVNLTSAQYQADFETLAAQGYRPSWISGNDSGSGVRFAVVFFRASVGFVAVHDRDEANFIADLASNEAAGRRLVTLCSYGTNPTLYGGIWIAGPHPARTYVHGQTLYEARLSSAAWAQQGYQTPLVDARLVANELRFTSYYMFDDATNVWQATGPTFPALSGFDAAVQKYMQVNSVRNGALAVTWQSRLVLARGYTWAPRTAPSTDATSLFRIASLSKPLTSVGTLRLVESGRMGHRGVDTLLKDKIALGNWPVVDSRVNRITLRHLLEHRGGFDRSISGDPMSADAAISADLSRPLPIGTKDVIDWMKLRPLDFAPGSQYQYSNFGYCLLGRVIEAVTGQTYDDYMYDEVLGPVGAGGMRLTDSLFGTQVPGEVIYGNLAGIQAGSVMGPSGPPSVPVQYGGAWNLRNFDSSGGYVASAVDLARFAVAFDDRDRSPLLGRATIDLMHMADMASDHYGLGWVVIPSGARLTTSHAGMLSPDSTKTWLLRRPGINWVVLFNTAPSDSSIEGALHTAANGVAIWPAANLFDQLAHVVTFGQGCTGNAGPTRLRPEPGSLPHLGDLLELRAESLPPSPTRNFPFLLMGFSKTRWRGVSLPLSLASAGMPDCRLNVGADSITPLVNAGGVARAAIRIPNATFLIGGKVHFQVIVTDPSANAGGLVVSHGLTANVGGK